MNDTHPMHVLCVLAMKNGTIISINAQGIICKSAIFSKICEAIYEQESRAPGTSGKRMGDARLHGDVCGGNACCLAPSRTLFIYLFLVISIAISFN